MSSDVGRVGLEVIWVRMEMYRLNNAFGKKGSRGVHYSRKRSTLQLNDP